MLKFPQHDLEVAVFSQESRGRRSEDTEVSSEGMAEAEEPKANAARAVKSVVFMSKRLWDLVAREIKGS